MTEIKVNTENMRTTANAFQDKIDEWKGLVNQLWSLTEELNGMWEGDANISFNEMVDADRPRFDRLAGMMETYLWGDRIFEKCGIGRDERGDGGKTPEIRGKRRLSARDGGANYQQS